MELCLQLNKFCLENKEPNSLPQASSQPTILKGRPFVLELFIADKRKSDTAYLPFTQVRIEMMSTTHLCIYLAVLKFYKLDNL